jgi:hypothetical protein
MKKTVFTLVFALYIIVCAGSQANNIPGLVKETRDIPDFVNRLPARTDTLYGVGVALGGDEEQTMAIAENHARKDLVRKIIETVPAVSDYIEKAAKGSWDPYLIQIVELADQHLMDALTYTGITTVEQRVQTPDKAIWYLISIKKTDAVKIITTTDSILR